jgi:hypothetical protein
VVSSNLSFPPLFGKQVEITCVSVEDPRLSCVDIELPFDEEAEDCIQEVEFTYTMTNDSDEVQRIYSLVITQMGVVSDASDVLFPTFNVEPGADFVVKQRTEVDICNMNITGASHFSTTAAFVTGPPCDVEINIACMSVTGIECRALPQIPADTPPDECLVDVVYTYTIENTGNIDANIIELTRTRNDMFVDLIGQLNATFLTINGTTTVIEVEEISLCVAQQFTTNTIVKQIPNADLLCDDIGFYPTDEVA